MQAFQAIANAIESRTTDAFAQLWRARVQGVGGLCRAGDEKPGYNVDVQPYTFPYFAYTARPVFSEVSPTFTITCQYRFQSRAEHGDGDASSLQPAGASSSRRRPPPSSSSGCTASDFSGFVAGRIALIQRGTCNFGVKVQNAQAAGHSGVIIFNEGNPDRTDAQAISLSDAANNPIIPTIPVASVLLRHWA